MADAHSERTIRISAHISPELLSRIAPIRLSALEVEVAPDAPSLPQDRLRDLVERRRSTLGRLEIEIEASAAGEWLRQQARKKNSSFTDLQLEWLPAGVRVQGIFDSFPFSLEFTISLDFAGNIICSLERSWTGFDTVDRAAARKNSDPAPALTIARELILMLFPNALEQSVEMQRNRPEPPHVTESRFCVLQFPIPKLLAMQLFPPSGLRLPTVSNVRLSRYVSTEDRIVLEYSESESEPRNQSAPPLPAWEERIDPSERALQSGEIDRAAQIYLGELRQGHSPRWLVDRALDLLSTLPGRADEAHAVSVGALARDPNVCSALSLLAKQADSAHEFEQAGRWLSRQAEALARGGDQFASDYAAISAARRLSLDSQCRSEVVQLLAPRARLLRGDRASAEQTPNETRTLLSRGIRSAVHENRWDIVETGALALLLNTPIDNGAQSVGSESDLLGGAELAALLAQSADKRGARAAAIDRYEALLDRNDATSQQRSIAWERLAELFEASGDVDQAAETLRASAYDLSAGPAADRANRLFRISELARRHPSHAIAGRSEALLEETLRVSPNHLGALDALEELHNKQGALDRVAVILGRKIAIVKQVAPRRALLMRLATLHAKLGETDAAIATLERVQGEQPDYLPALTALVQIHLERGSEVALKVAEKYAQLLIAQSDPATSPGASDNTALLDEWKFAWSALARIAEQRDDDVALDRAIATISSRAPDHPQIVAIRRRAAIRRKSIEELEQIETAAHNRATDNAQRAAALIRHSGALLEWTDRTRQAGELLSRALSLGGENPLALERLSAVLGRLGAADARGFMVERLLSALAASSTTTGVRALGPDPIGALATSIAHRLTVGRDPDDADGSDDADELARFESRLVSFAQSRAELLCSPAHHPAVLALRDRMKSGVFVAAAPPQSGEQTAESLRAIDMSLVRTDDVEATSQSALALSPPDIDLAAWALDTARLRATVIGDATKEATILLRMATVPIRDSHLIGGRLPWLVWRLFELAPDPTITSERVAHRSIAMLLEPNLIGAVAAITTASEINERFAQCLERGRAAGDRTLIRITFEAWTRLLAEKGETAAAIARVSEALAFSAKDIGLLRLSSDLTKLVGDTETAAKQLDKLAHLVTDQRFEITIELWTLLLESGATEARIEDVEARAHSLARTQQETAQAHRLSAKTAQKNGWLERAVEELEAIEERLRTDEDRATVRVLKEQIAEMRKI